MRNIKVILEYDGTNFYGWQVQPGMRTVQGVLEKAIEKLLSKKIKTIGAGRTDTGVHAIGQVANFFINKRYELETIKKALNTYLPQDIFIKNIEEVNTNFHSRFNAKMRTYIYRISKQFSVFTRNYSWYYKYPLDIQAMNDCCKLLLGEKDLTSFSVTKSKKDNMVMSIKKCIFTERKNEVVFTIKADRFLHKSVRTIVGTLILVGEGKLSAREFKSIIIAKDRRKAGKTAPPYGLYLKEVKY